MNLSAGMVVIGCKDGGIAQYGFTDDDANIYAHLGDSFLADFHGLDKFVVIVRYNDGSMEAALPRTLSSSSNTAT